MSFFRIIRTFFSIESLEPSLIKTDEENKNNLHLNKNNNKASKWSSKEFIFYYIIILITSLFFLHTALSVSSPKSIYYNEIEEHLSNGWIFKRKIDLTDKQYSFFRNNFIKLFAITILYSFIEKLISLKLYNELKQISLFFLNFTFIIVIHGVNVILLFFFFLTNYFISSFIRSKKKVLFLTWLLNLIFLIAIKKINVLEFIRFPKVINYLGLVPRWDVFFNFSILRMISFSVDKINSKTVENDKNFVEEMDNEEKVKLSEKDYNFISYINYLIFFPLYFVGPIISFNDFTYQSHYNAFLLRKNFKWVLTYFFRAVFCFLVLEVMLHYIYALAIFKTSIWFKFKVIQIIILGFFNLSIIWLKLLVPWRFFRFWSLLAGINPPENMFRCMCNNYSVIYFWRSWHRSFNLWILKYIYIPLGGKKKRTFFTKILVFFFVAIWHDLEVKLFIWGVFNVFFIIYEYIVFKYLYKFEEKKWFKHALALSSTINILLLIITNFTGFVYNANSLFSILMIYGDSKTIILFLLGCFIVLPSGIHIMFEIRDDEKKRSLNLKF